MTKISLEETNLLKKNIKTKNFTELVAVYFKS